MRQPNWVRRVGQLWITAREGIYLLVVFNLNQLEKDLSPSGLQFKVISYKQFRLPAFL